MSHTNKDITLLILAQLNGTASEHELNELEQWLESDPLNKKEYTQLKAIMGSNKPIEHTQQETEMAYSRIEKTIKERTNSSTAQPGKIKSYLPVKMAIGIAASIILAIVIYYSADRTSKSDDPIATITKNCPRGEKLHLTLSDGSEVWLNSDSRITFPEYFEINNRSISLEGEAFFEVVKNEQKPFVVLTSNSQIKVLGTSFNVNNQSIDNITETTVVSGTVLVSSSFKNQSVTLVKNQHVKVDATGQLLKEDNIDPESIIDWKDNKLYFNDVSLAEVFKEIEPWFDITIQVNDESIYRKKLRAKFSNPSLNQLLDHISKVMDIDYQIEGKTVVIQTPD